MFQLRSDAERLADAVEASGKKLGSVWISREHGPARGLSLIEATREYLEAFATAVQTGNADDARVAMMGASPTIE